MSLERSPLDDAPPTLTPLVTIGDHSKPRWVASRFNIRATTEGGRLVLWNSYSGSISAFEPDQKETILNLIRPRNRFQAKNEGIVKYLADRGYLVRENTDELRRVQYAFGQEHYRTDTLELILLASEDCNFRCTYCYEDFARGTMQPKTRLAVKRLVEKRLSHVRRLRISWFGGEPLYGFEAVEDLAPFFVSVAARSQLDFGCHMTTNGYLLTPEVADKLLSWRVNDYQITVDGSPEDHDQHRPTRDGRGTYSTIFANLEAMRRRQDDFSVGIRINFDQENHPRLERFLDDVERVFGDDPRFSVTFHAVGRWGGPNDADLAVCGTDEGSEVMRRLKAAARERGLDVGGGLKDVRGPGSQVCYAARPYNFIIGAHGQVMKCTIVLDKDSYNVVGRLREDGELELDDDKMALWTEPAFENDGKCRQCVIVPTCQGIHCPKIRIEENRRPCPDTRLAAKRELSELFSARESSGRRVGVSARMASRWTPVDG